LQPPATTIRDTRAQRIELQAVGAGFHFCVYRVTLGDQTRVAQDLPQRLACASRVGSERALQPHQQRAIGFAIALLTSFCIWDIAVGASSSSRIVSTSRFSSSSRLKSTPSHTFSPRSLRAVQPCRCPLIAEINPLIAKIKGLTSDGARCTSPRGKNPFGS
jgi:hypothetical protein